MLRHANPPNAVPTKHASNPIKIGNEELLDFENVNANFDDGNDIHDDDGVIVDNDEDDSTSNDLVSIVDSNTKFVESDDGDNISVDDIDCDGDDEDDVDDGDDNLRSFKIFRLLHT